MCRLRYHPLGRGGFATTPRQPGTDRRSENRVPDRIHAGRCRETRDRDRRINTIGKPLAGKTGTTNESRDTWFVGFSPDLAVGVYVGSDKPKPLGKRETGSFCGGPDLQIVHGGSAAEQAGHSVPGAAGASARACRFTNRQAGAQGITGVILEAFLPGTVPTSRGRILDGSDGNPRPGNGVVTPRASFAVYTDCIKL